MRVSFLEPPFSASSAQLNETVVNSGLIKGGIFLDGGDDVSRGNTGTVTVTGRVNGWDGNDLLIGGDEDNVLLGGDGADTLDGNADNDMLRGGEGDHTLTGGTGSDALYGGNGDDTLEGEGGADTLLGGLGDDVMTDFDNGTDCIDVRAFGLGGFGGISAAITGNGGDAFIDWSVIGGEGFLVVEGAQELLNAGGFIF